MRSQQAELGFSVDRNEVSIICPDPEEVIHVSAASKHEIAGRILDRVREVLK